MDQRRMDAEGGRVVHRSRRAAGKLAVVVAVQNLLVVACLLATYYVYQDFQTLPEDTHIQFDAVTGLLRNVTVKFNGIRSSYNFEMNEEKDVIYIKCTGPYIWHMEVCYENRQSADTDPGTLQLQVKGSKAPVSSINLTATHLVCRGLHSTAYLRANEKASLHLSSKDGLLIRNITMGLSYLLGKKCDY